MRVFLFIGLAVLLAIIVLILLLKVIKGLVLKIVVVIVAVMLFFGGGQVINLNTLSPSVESKISEVTDRVGSSSIKTEGNRVFVKLDNEWYDVSKLSLVDKTSDSIKLRYEGKEIYIGKSGASNTIKVLEDLGFLEKEK